MEQHSSFIHTGFKHTMAQHQNDGNFHLVLDRIEYASAIKPVALPKLMKMKLIWRVLETT